RTEPWFAQARRRHGKALAADRERGPRAERMSAHADSRAIDTHGDGVARPGPPRDFVENELDVADTGKCRPHTDAAAHRVAQACAVAGRDAIAPQAFIAARMLQVDRKD